MSDNILKDSSWFDADWYRAKYPDVVLSGLAAEEHYLRVGEALGRQPCLGFDPAWYLAEYLDVAQAGVSPLLHFIVHGEEEGRLPVRVAALEYEAELWRQHAGDPEPSLAALYGLAERGGRETSYAAWALARWYAWRGEWQRVALLLERRDHREAQRLPRHPAPWLLEVEALTRLGGFSAAEACLAELEDAEPDFHDARLARANLLAARAAVAGDPQCHATERLRLLNVLWREHGLAEVSLTNPAAGLSLDNLTLHSPLSTPHLHAAHSPLISVIIPAHNAAAGLPTALASLAAQRGVSLEVIVVDDASSDTTAEVAEAFAAGDARFRVLRQAYNQGAYAARNRGLAEARGELITVHDSDDWSHPDKLATQVAGLEAHPEWQACCSHLVRCTSALVFGHWRLEQGWTYRNVSSLMFRRQVFEALGCWDRVRVDADTEYYHRIRAVFGGQALGEVLPGVPLAFGRSAANSLSQAGPTHLVTQFAGLRREYQQAALAWHRRGEGDPRRLYLPDKPAERPFAAPAAMLP